MDLEDIMLKQVRQNDKYSMMQHVPWNLKRKQKNKNKHNKTDSVTDTGNKQLITEGERLRKRVR